MYFSIQKYQHAHWPRIRELIPNRVKFWDWIDLSRQKHNKTKWQKDLLNPFNFREKCFVEKELSVVLSVELDLSPWLIFLDGVRLDFYLVPKIRFLHSNSTFEESTVLDIEPLIQSILFLV